MQPTNNTRSGHRKFRVIFSSFRNDSIPEYKNCVPESDGSIYGVTCRAFIPGSLGDTFLFNVSLKKDLTIGAVTNKTTGREDVIGKWTVGSDAKYFMKDIRGFSEDYNNSSVSCDAKGWPYYKVKYLPPLADHGTIQETVDKFDIQPDKCPGAITSEHDATGTTVEAGYK